MHLYSAVSFLFLCCFLENSVELYPKESDSNDRNIVVRNIDRNKHVTTDPPKIGWVDPFDMLGEDHIDNPNLFTFNEVQNSQLKSRSALCLAHLSMLVNLLSRAIETQIDPKESIHLAKLEFLITDQQLNVLRQFSKHGNDDSKLATVSDVISKLLTSNGHSKEIYGFEITRWLKNASLKIINSPEWTVVVSVSVLFLSTLWAVYINHSYRQALFLVFLTIFFAGYGFTWIRMYEEKEVERYLAIVKHGGYVPYHCSGANLRWYEHMYYRMFGDDCLQFYQKRDIRPMFKISPIEVLAETLSSLLISPLTTAGIIYGNFIINVTSPVSFWLKPIAMFFGFIMPPMFFCILIALFFNYCISFSFTGFHIMPSWYQKRENIKCKQGCQCQYVSDIPGKENESSQKHSNPQTDWPRFKKLISYVTNNEEIATVADKENHNEENDDLKNDESEGLTSIKKQSSKKRPRSNLTIGEGCSGKSVLEDDAEENYEPVDESVSQASGDYCECITVNKKKIQSKEKN